MKLSNTQAHYFINSEELRLKVDGYYNDIYLYSAYTDNLQLIKKALELGVVNRVLVSELAVEGKGWVTDIKAIVLAGGSILEYSNTNRRYSPVYMNSIREEDLNIVNALLKAQSNSPIEDTYIREYRLKSLHGGIFTINELLEFAISKSEKLEPKASQE